MKKKKKLLELITLHNRKVLFKILPNDEQTFLDNPKFNLNEIKTPLSRKSIRRVGSYTKQRGKWNSKYQASFRNTERNPSNI